jgi:isocitrate dehydrogenase kinase/phosphatase
LLVFNENLSLQNVIRALRDKFQPLEENTREQVKEDYKRILERGRIGLIDPKVWIIDWFQALAQVQIYHILEVEGFLAIKDFLQAVSIKFLPTWTSQQLALIIEANTLSKPVRTLEQYGKIFEALIQETIQTSGRSTVFATLGARLDSPSSHSCPCKESRTEKHP